MRKAFNHATGNLIEVGTSDGHCYYFNIKKRSGAPTRLYGSGYEEFVSDYDMRCGEKILFNMKDSPEIIPIWQETANGETKHRVQGIIIFFAYLSFCIFHVFSQFSVSICVVFL